MRTSIIKVIFQLVILHVLMSVTAFSADTDKQVKTAVKKLAGWKNPFPEWQYIGKPKIDSVKLFDPDKLLVIYFSPELSYYPLREESTEKMKKSVKDALGRKFRKYNIDIITSGYSLDRLIPNYFRVAAPVDSARLPKNKVQRRQLIERSLPYQISEGLQDNSIALWHSHGYYYEPELDRWEFQRAKLFGTTEDISVMGIVVPYLAPMLENAGANVFMPRERDIQKNEVIVDNDGSSGNSVIVLQNADYEVINRGFLKIDTLFAGQNPFAKGTSGRISGDSVLFVPEIPENGKYAVYVSYPSFADNTKKASYTITHTGGKNKFTIDQTIGGGTWIYLGSFDFSQGVNKDIGAVVITAPDSEKIAFDAVRFGGGMGNVARRPVNGTNDKLLSLVRKQNTPAESSNKSKPAFTWKTSGKPRFIEAARYYLQYAGMPDSLVYTPSVNVNDYNDDYQSRGYWVNYLMSDPYQDISTGRQGGLGLPLDISFGFHSDAGITPDDSIIGTLAIYSTGLNNGYFNDSTSRLASRDLADIVQTTVVEDIRKQFNPDWTRRGLWDKPYAEARRPDVPAMLFELYSHQNISDLTYGLDPRFRFAVSRAVYKGILKYISFVNKTDYQVQPLPVDHFGIEYIGAKKIRLSWQPVYDTLEASATPTGYIVYKSIDANGFDNGIIVNDTTFTLEIESYDIIYNFKVKAFNGGGESFDSEVLSAGLKENDENPVLVVNGFDRICGPAFTDSGVTSGVAYWIDRGVPDGYDFISIGDQYDYDRKSEWTDDDAPGWGATYSDRAGMVSKGNTFNFPYIHGKAIMAAGHSFISVSDEYFVSGRIDTGKFKNVDLIYGEEKSTRYFSDTTRTDFKIYDQGLMTKISELTESSTNIFISGSYLGSDLKIKGDSIDINFARDVLHFKFRTGHAVNTGGVYSTDYVQSLFKTSFGFNTDFSDKFYQVEAPDAIEPADKSSVTAFRYSENNTSAGIAFSGKYKTLVLGFPFETITDEEKRNDLMRKILDFFDN